MMMMMRKNNKKNQPSRTQTNQRLPKKTKELEQRRIRS